MEKVLLWWGARHWSKLPRQSATSLEMISEVERTLIRERYPGLWKAGLN